MKFKIGTEGTIQAVYSDKIKNMNLGKLEVSRASNVEFNAKTQEWEATTLSGELIAHGPSRDDVIKEEVRIIESRL